MNTINNKPFEEPVKEVLQAKPMPVQQFDVSMDFTKAIENKLDNMLINVLGVSVNESCVYSRLVGIEVLCLLTELNLSESQLETVKKHTKQVLNEL